MLPHQSQEAAELRMEQLRREAHPLGPRVQRPGSRATRPLRRALGQRLVRLGQRMADGDDTGC